MQAVNKDELLKKAGENLRNIRKEKQMEIKEVGKKLKITPQAYGSIENGKVDLSLSRLVSIANLYEVGLEQIINATGMVIHYNSSNNSGNNNFSHIGTTNMPSEQVLQDLLNQIGQLRQELTQNQRKDK